MIDCLIVGFNDGDFGSYTDMVKGMGTDSGAYRDLSLAFFEYENKPYRSLDMLNHFYQENRSGISKPFHNADFLWPVVLYLGSYLSRRGLSFDYINLFHLEKEQLKEKLVNNEVLTIAITTTLYVSPHPILEIVSFIREHNDAAKIVIGGPYISNQAKLIDRRTLEQEFEYLGGDFYVISNEGEATLVNLIRALKTGSDLKSVDNIAYRRGANFEFTAASIESNPLEENMVDYGLFPREQIGEFLSLRTAKSCPFSCSFCGFPQRAGKYKYLDVPLVEKELDSIRDIGTVTTLTFLDDTFNVPKERFREILRMMIRNQYGFKWNSFYRSDHGDDETIELMGKAGCEGVFLGVESGSDEMLQKMNKTARRKDYLRSIPRLREAGISTHANVIVGFPGETYATVQETIDLIEETKPDFFRSQLWYADPVTPIWNKRAEYGIEGSAFLWSHKTMDYRMACDFVDKMFLCVENSVWLPQNGFEQWSTFYLQRKGMTLHQIKNFLRCFNAIIKENLITSGKGDISPALLEPLRGSARFDQPDEADMRPVELLSGSRYMEAERYLIKEFSGKHPSSAIDSIVHHSEGSSDEWGSTVRDLDDLFTEKPLDKPFGRAAAMLAAYSILLSRLTDLGEITIVAAVNTSKGATVLPLRLIPGGNLTFAEYASSVQQKIEKVAEYDLSAFHILTNPLRLATANCTPPVFDIGYVYDESADAAEYASWKRTLKIHAKVEAEMKLVLRVYGSGEGLRLEFLYAQRWLKPEVVNGLAVYLKSICEVLAKTPDNCLDELTVDGEEQESDPMLVAHAAENFLF